MSIPNTSIEFVEGGRGAVPAAATGVVAHIGACSSGTVGTLYAFRSYRTLVATLGEGPIVRAAAADIQAVGVAYAMRATAAVGVQAAWTQSGAGPLVSSTGTPLDAYRLRVKIVAGGLRGTATFKVSLDGGRTYGDTLVTAATSSTIAAATGITIAFATGTYVAEEVYTSDSAAPYYTSGNALTALDSLLADPREWAMVHFVGAPASIADLLSLAGSVDTAMEDAADNMYRFSRALLEAPDGADSTVDTEMVALATARVCITFGYCEFTDPVSKRSYYTSIANEYTGRIAKIDISTHPGQVQGGAMLGRVTSLSRDESATPGPDDARFITARTIVGASGFYFTRGRTFAGTGSDYGSHPICRVADEAARVARLGLLQYQNKGVRLADDTGFILEEEASSIDADLLAKLGSALRGHASSISFTCTRDADLSVQEEPELTGELSFIPKGYLEHINFRLGVARASA